MFAPVGYAGASVKIAPPLVTPEDAIREGVGVLEEAMREASGDELDTICPFRPSGLARTKATKRTKGQSSEQAK
jgi:hypothetical protein